jgi:hypothetical protein
MVVNEGLYRQMETRNAIRISEKLKGKSWELFYYHLQRRDLPSFPIVCTRSFHCLLGSIEVQNNFAAKLSIPLNIKHGSKMRSQRDIRSECPRFCNPGILLRGLSIFVFYCFEDCSITAAVIELRIKKFS